MATTPLGIRYPTSASTVDVAGDMANLANDVDGLLTRPASVQDDDGAATDGSTTSLTYVASLTTTGICGQVFTAPKSGRVVVMCAALARNSSAGQSAFMDFQVSDGAVVGSGTVRRPTNVNTEQGAQSDSAGQNLPLSMFGLVTGLTPGNVYNAYMMHKAVSSGTAFYNRRNIVVLNGLG